MSATKSGGPTLTTRFEDALSYAFRLHNHQDRKGSDIPYFSHLMGVTALVLEDGGDEDQAIAALLHDAVEDQGGRAILEEIRRLFGERVANIVDGCTDSYSNPKPPWQSRKEEYIQHLYQASEDVIRVSLADKLHNTRTILSGLRENGDQVWERFRGKKDGTLWYYRSLIEAFKKITSGYMVDELERVVDEIERLAGGNNP
jgi:(p)ppGpp synthase/HD superfamily hydrolase